MRSRLSALAITLATASALGLAACGGEAGDAAGGTASGEPIAKIAAPAGQQWSRVVNATEEGFVMGNPDAPLKVVEYGSFTCSHCAEFSVTSREELMRDYVDTGRVSFEMRPYVRDPLDLMLAATAVCAGPERFFPLAENIFSGFEEVVSGAQAAPNAAQNIASLPEAERFTSLARAWRVDQFFAARGVPATELDRCLTDSEALTRRETVVRSANERYEIAGTPTFLLNGTVMEGVGTWDQMKTRLQTAGAR
jgi:protein-disulfide isomerase